MTYTWLCWGATDRYTSVKSVAQFREAYRTEFSISVPQSCTGEYPEPSPPLLAGLQETVRYADVSRCPASSSANGLEAESPMCEEEELRGDHFHRQKSWSTSAKETSRSVLTELDLNQASWQQTQGSLVFWESHDVTGSWTWNRARHRGRQGDSGGRNWRSSVIFMHHVTGSHPNDLLFPASSGIGRSEFPEVPLCFWIG